MKFQSKEQLFELIDQHGIKKGVDVWFDKHIHEISSDFNITETKAIEIKQNDEEEFFVKNLVVQTLSRFIGGALFNGRRISITENRAPVGRRWTGKIWILLE